MGFNSWDLIIQDLVVRDLVIVSVVINNYRNNKSHGRGPSGPNVLKLFETVIYNCSKKARVFVPDKSFHPSLLVRPKFTRVKHLSAARSSVRSWPYPLIRLPWKVFVQSKPFQPSLAFVNKTKALVLHAWVGSWLCPQTLDKH